MPDCEIVWYTSSGMARSDNRADNELRPVRIVLGYQSFAEGSALIELGKTRVLCSVSMEPRNKSEGRSQEIQRIIGRSLRAATDLAILGERTFVVDCDVLQADGGTRTAAITGGYVALYHAFHNLREQGVLPTMPLTKMVAATSVGVVGGDMLLDLCYQEDYQAEVDFNVVMTDKNEFVEIQGTAEGKPFTKETTDTLLSLARQGIAKLFKIQKETLRALS